MNALLAVTPKTKSKPRDWDAITALQNVAHTLREMAYRDENTVSPITDALANDTAENFQAVTVAIEEARAALCEVETHARCQLEVETAYYRENLEAILALGVPLEA